MFLFCLWQKTAATVRWCVTVDLLAFYRQKLICVCVYARMRSEDFLVHVKAQVMSRDDNKGGWVPRGAGGMSIISLCRLPARSSSQADVGSRELLIYGRRIADKSVTSTRGRPGKKTTRNVGQCPT